MKNNQKLFGINEHGFYFTVSGPLCAQINPDTFKGKIFAEAEKTNWEDAIPEEEDSFYAWHFEYCELEKDIYYTTDRGLSNLCDTANFQAFLEEFEV